MKHVYVVSWRPKGEVLYAIPSIDAIHTVIQREFPGAEHDVSIVVEDGLWTEVAVTILNEPEDDGPYFYHLKRVTFVEG